AGRPRRGARFESRFPCDQKALERSKFAPSANPFAPEIQGRNRTYYGDGLGIGSLMKSTRRGNYESGSDYVLEYGELRFTFNERDFTERVEQAAVKLGFVEGQLDDEEREDLVNLAVNGHVENPTSALGEHVNSSWQDLDGPSERSLTRGSPPSLGSSVTCVVAMRCGSAAVPVDASTVTEPASCVLRPAPNTRRTVDAGSVSSESITTAASWPCSAARLARCTAR